MINIVEVKESLKIIAKRLEKIENKDVDYTTNLTWLILRSKQDRLYQILKDMEDKRTIKNQYKEKSRNE